ncbi:glycosyl hydrolase [Cohnella zeiphila]|uniref:Glycoside hydrolase n=1 Tax=Cohnella zeiphila TaxID=2761120 RepID=A0A7X0SUL2_9BACL|nr:glycosyl hydrolase [Cohnella zeiphila]MBB6734163.1 hypothetical protein [Cohnella zeiphila]
MLDRQRFRRPLKADRIHPFWFWNGEMADEQIRRQIDEMADKGLGGFFICARQGMKLSYLSDEWFDKVRVAVEAAARHGLHVWLYDEYPYPSGIAGGEVTLEYPEAKHRTLVSHSQAVAGGDRVSLELPWAKILYAKAVPVAPDGRRLWDEAVPVRSAIGNYQAEPVFQKTGLTAYNQKRFFTYRTVQKLDWTAPAGEWELLIVQEKEIDDFKYYGTFVDPCNREAMAAFIRLTHDKYAERFGEYFGTTIKGMFTDEIGLLGRIPWSPRLVDFFRERCGYDLRDHLHALFDPDAENAAAIRYDYYQSVHLLLRDSYHKQVHDWCERHGLEYVAEVPAVRHTTQLYSHVPGGDSAHEKLGRSLEWILDKNAVNLRSNPKMVSSLARQLGRERNLIECFHSVGWSMTLQDARWMIDRMAAFGTNFFNFHAFFYTVDGLAQHDAPPSQFWQNPYWKHFGRLADYAGRIGFAMSTGQAVIETAVLQPTTSLWTQMGNPLHRFDYGGGRADEKERLEHLLSWWAGICKELTMAGRDFDHLDPELLAEAEIEDGRIKLGRARYSVLILPPMTNLEGAAWRRIESFLRSGGTVVAMGQLPYERIEADWDPRSAAAAFNMEEPEARFWLEAREEERPAWRQGERAAYYLPFPAKADAKDVLPAMTELLDRVNPLPVRLSPACGEQGLLMQTRLVQDDTALVFVSNQEGEERETELYVDPQLLGLKVQEAESPASSAVLSACELSLDSGEAGEPLRPADARQDGAAAIFPLRLAPYEARLFELKLDRTAAAKVADPASAECPRWEVSAAGPWEMKALGPNALRLDTFRLAVYGHGAAGPAAADHAPIAEGTVMVKTFIDQCADLAEAGGLPVQMRQTFGTPMRVGIAYPLKAVYTAEFAVEEAPRSAELLMDRSAIGGTAVIRLNGHTVAGEEFRPAFLYDHNNVAADVSRRLLPGTVNTLTVEVDVENDWEGVVDALYLAGPFRVRFDPQAQPVLSAIQTEEEAQPVPALGAGPYPGYPYYAGDFSFAKTAEWPDAPEGSAFELTFPDLDPDFHDCAEVLINGRSLGVRAWSPYRWIGDASMIRKGANRLEVRVTNTLIGLLEGQFFDYRGHAVRPVRDRKEL